MKNKANKLTLSLATMVLTFLCAQPEAAQAQIGISQLRAPDGNPNPALSVDNSGNVGIGTTAPGNFKLQVAGSVRFGNNMEIGQSGSHYDEIAYNTHFTAVNDAYNYVGTDYASSIRLGFSGSAAGGMEFRTAPAGNTGSPLTLTARMVLTEAGDLGIGTTAPLYRLHVAGSAAISNAGEGAGRLHLNGERRWQFRQLGTGSGTALELASVLTGQPNGGKNFIINTSGRVGIGTTSPEATLDVNGQIRCTTLLLTSDRNAKADFRPVDARALLKKVASLPLSTWHYTNAPGVRHLGPMAQDFKAAFPEIGSDDKHIATVDADGVALASIQALYDVMQEKDSEIAALRQQISTLKTELAGVKESVADRLAALEKAMPKNVLQAYFRPEAAR